MAQQTPVGGTRVAPPAPGSRRPGMAPLPAKGKRRGRWLFWLLILPLMLLGLTYGLGRSVEQIRVRLLSIPLAGKLLFSDPVWPILWNKKTAPAPAQGTGAGGAVPSESAGGSVGVNAPELTRVEAEAAARLAAAEVKENDLRRLEADLKARESALQAKQFELASQQARLTAQETRLADQLKQTEALRKQLEGELKSEQDRVEVIRAMRSSAVQQLFSAMTDEEVIRVLKYMTAEEVARYLSGFESFRSARILHSLREVAPASAP